jgi:HK97 gp10 family phage protein
MALETYGFEDFDKTLAQMGDEFGYTDVNKRTLVPALKRALLTALPTAQSLVRKNTGRLKESLSVISKRPTDRDKRSKYISDADAAIGMLSAHISDVSLAEEFGTAKRPGQPFIRPALETNQSNIINKLSEELKTLIDKYQARKNKDLKR